MISSELLSLVMGPLGAFALSLYLVSKLWAELQAERKAREEERLRLTAEVDREQAARLNEAHETANALLQMQARVIKSVELFEERPCIAQGFRKELPTLTDLEPPPAPRPPPPVPPSLIPTIGRHSRPGEPPSGAT